VSLLCGPSATHQCVRLRHRHPASCCTPGLSLLTVSCNIVDAASLDSGMFYSIKGANADPSTGSLYTETLTGTSVPSSKCLLSAS